MPLYEYECQQCGDRFEVIQKFSDPLVTVHEGCGGVVKKLLSAPAIQFKGSGWYVTDYARKGANGESKDSKESRDSKDSKESKKADGESKSGSGESKDSKETKKAEPAAKASSDSKKD